MRPKPVTLAQLHRFAYSRSEATVQTSAAFLSSPSGLPGRGEASALIAEQIGWQRLDVAWRQASTAIEELKAESNDLSGFCDGLEEAQKGLEDEVRGFTFDLQAAWEKQGPESTQLTSHEAQVALRCVYHDLVCWRTMVSQHCTVARMQLDQGDAEPPAATASERGAWLVGAYGLGPVVARNPLAEVARCAVEDARAFTVEKFGVAPEVSQHGVPCLSNPFRG